MPQTIRIRADGDRRLAGAEVELIAPERLGDRLAHQLSEIDAVGPEPQVAALQVADRKQVGGEELDVLCVVFDGFLVVQRVRVAWEEPGPRLGPG